jgi:cytoskeletal protein CcmA (bactofilin family)
MSFKSSHDADVKSTANAHADSALPSVSDNHLNMTVTACSLIGKALSIKGDIGAKEDMQINGRIEGTIAVKNNRVEIGESGFVKANVFAKTVVISGKVEGDVYASDRIIVTDSGDVEGNIHAGDITIEDGAKLKGSIDMQKQDIFKQHTGSTEVHEEQHGKSSAFNFLFRKPRESAHLEVEHKEIEFPAAAEPSPLAMDSKQGSNSDRSMIGESVMIKGEITSGEDVLIQGEIEGVIYFKANSLGVGPHASIKGNVFVKAMVGQGQVKGDIYASERVILRKPCHVTGMVHAPRISIESGAVLSGGVEMEPQNIDKVFSTINDSSLQAMASTAMQTGNAQDGQKQKDAGSQSAASLIKDAGMPIFYPRS